MIFLEIYIYIYIYIYPMLLASSMGSAASRTLEQEKDAREEKMAVLARGKVVEVATIGTPKKTLSSLPALQSIGHQAPLLLKVA